MSEPHQFVPQVSAEPGGVLSFRGVDMGRGAPGARITPDTRCAKCGQRFKNGDTLIAHLHTNFDDARIEHDGDCPDD